MTEPQSEPKAIYLEDGKTIIGVQKPVFRGGIWEVIKIIEKPEINGIPIVFGIHKKTFDYRNNRHLPAYIVGDTLYVCNSVYCKYKNWETPEFGGPGVIIETEKTQIFIKDLFLAKRISLTGWGKYDERNGTRTLKNFEEKIFGVKHVPGVPYEYPYFYPID